MERLDGPLADLVAAEREEIEAMPRSKEAAWAGIAAGWQAPPPPAGPTGVPEAAAAGKASLLKAVAVLVVGTSVAAGAYAVGSDDTSAPVARVEAPAIEPPAVDHQPPPRPETLPIVAPPPARPQMPARPETPVSHPEAPASQPKPKAPALGLAEELALIDAMRRDVAAGRYAEALARAKEHRASFARGRLVADRMDLEAAARCGHGDEKAGRALAQRKAKRWPRAPMSKPLRTLCNLDE